MTLNKLIIILIFSSFFLSPTASGAENELKPLWEAGIAGGGGQVADYPAAAQSHTHGIILPYVAYRGKTLRMGDGKGIIRGRYMPSDKLELDLSLSGSFSTESSSNDARIDMPDLDYLAEVGPRLQLTLAEFGENSKIDLEIPLRAVFSSDFSNIHYRGIIFQPELAFQHDNILRTKAKFKLSAGPIFASQDFMGYLYEVPRHFVRANRPEFSAQGGYLGSKFKAAFAKQINSRLNFFGMANISYYGDATNEDSPLHLDNTNFNIGFGFVWSFWQSQKMTSD